MGIVELVLWFILGLRPEWRPDACEDIEWSQEVCEHRRDEGRAWAEKLAAIIAAEAERQSLPWDWLAATIRQESDFAQGDICPLRLAADRIVSREVMDAEVGRERICWTYRVHREAAAATNCQPVLVLEATEAELLVDRCAYGEAGLMQIRDHEARAGMVVPATGEELPRSRRARHERILDPEVNISLGAVAIAAGRDECCGDDEACRGEPELWWGVFNSGQCSNRRYVSTMKRHIADGVHYLCEQMPDADGCSAEEVAR